MSVIRTVAKYKTAIFIVIAAIVVFFWYEVRPALVFRRCSARAVIESQSLLASKASAMQGSTEGEALQSLVDQRLYLRADYDSFLMKCLASNGLQLEPLMSSEKEDHR